jgi:hypothetical protein
MINMKGNMNVRKLLLIHNQRKEYELYELKVQQEIQEIHENDLIAEYYVNIHPMYPRYMN